MISVAIPCYKGKFLAETIRSILNQTYQDFELIIVNDQSPEDIEAIVHSFNDPRIRYFVNEKNLGAGNPAYNWNRCLSHAQGEFFALLCDDDLYAPTFLERMMALAQKYPDTKVFRSRANFINAEGKEINRYASAPEWETWEDYLWHVTKNYRSQTISEWFYRREALTAVDGYALLPLAWYADYLSIFRFAQEGGIASTSEILVHFRLSGENISSRDDENTILKIEAQNQYRASVAELLKGNPQRDDLMNQLNWLLNLHLKYNLGHAPKRVLFQIYRNRRKYGISGKLIWHALWHKDG
jgi:glycosyltransferase involved in cell wall biosynthesis